MIDSKKQPRALKEFYSFANNLQFSGTPTQIVPQFMFAANMSQIYDFLAKKVVRLLVQKLEGLRKYVVVLVPAIVNIYIKILTLLWRKQKTNFQNEGKYWYEVARINTVAFTATSKACSVVAVW